MKRVSSLVRKGYGLDLGGSDGARVAAIAAAVQHHEAFGLQ
jgi:hypothetical protein